MDEVHASTADFLQWRPWIDALVCSHETLAADASVHALLKLYEDDRIACVQELNEFSFCDAAIPKRLLRKWTARSPFRASRLLLGRGGQALSTRPRTLVAAAAAAAAARGGATTTTTTTTTSCPRPPPYASPQHGGAQACANVGRGRVG